MRDIQKRPRIPKDQKFFDYLKESWDVEEYAAEEVIPKLGGAFQKRLVVYTHKNNKNIRFERMRMVSNRELYYARYPEAVTVMVRILDEMHTEIQDEIIQYLTPKED